MSKSLTLLNTANASHTFQTLVTRVNDLVNTLANVIVTTDTTANGGSTTGNAFVLGILAATTLATATLRGGNVQSNGLLSVTGNVVIANGFTSQSAIYVGGNTSANVYANTLGVYSPLFSSGNNSLTANGLTLNGTTYNTIISSINVVVGNNSGNTSKLQFIAGSGATIGYTANVSANSIDLTFSVSANVSGVTGSNTNIQFNDSGVLAGVNALAFNKTSNTVTVDNIAVKKAKLTYSELADTKIVYDTVSNNIVVDSFALTDYVGAEYVVYATSNTTNNIQMSKMLVMSTGTDVVYNEYAVMTNNVAVLSLSANANSSHIKLNLSSPISNCTLRVMRRILNTI